MILFVADQHLCPARPGTVHLFDAFLAGPARQATALYLLGDLFDAWAGDDDLGDPCHAHVCAHLHALAQTGVKIYFMAGNRDFLVADRFAAAGQLTLLTEPSVVEVDGIRALLLHGDTLCTDDSDYQNFRALVRAPAWQAEFLALSLGERKKRIDALRSRSEMVKMAKTPALMDANPAAVADAFRLYGVAHMVHGHTHRPACHEEIVDGRACQRWVLPQWHQQGGYLACDSDGWRLCAYPPARQG